jgi:flagellar biosynthetic protein FliO
MKKLAILLFALTAIAATAQEAGETEFPVIDENTLTFDGAADTNAAGTQGDIADNLQGSGISTADYLRMVFFLIVVIVIIWLFIKLLRRFSGNRFGEQDMINLIGSQNLTAETSLHVVEVENSYYLLGASQSNVSLITEIKDQETIDSLNLKRSRGHDRKGKTFWEMVTGITSSRQNPGEDASARSVDFLKNQRDRLKDL